MLSAVKRFVAWAFAGALITFGVLGLLSIGLPFLVAGTALTAWLTHRVGTDEAYGTAFGAAAVLFAVGTAWLFGSGFNPLVFFVPAAIALATGVAACFTSASHARQR
jgi:hypothetical protein